MKKKTNLYKKIIVICVVAYVSFTLINQQKTLNQYEQDRKELCEQIEEEKQYKQELAIKKENVNSLEFIEKMAREKLEMYYPNERVYVNKGI